MNATELHREWIDGEQTGVRPARVQRLRNDLQRETGLEIPRHRAEIEEWLEQHRDEVADRLADAAGVDEDESDAESDSESDSES